MVSANGKIVLREGQFERVVIEGNLSGEADHMSQAGIQVSLHDIPKWGGAVRSLLGRIWIAGTVFECVVNKDENQQRDLHAGRKPFGQKGLMFGCK